MTEKMIPLSVIDALIKKRIDKLENPDDPYDTRIGDNSKIIVLEHVLEEIKKEAIVPNQSLSSTELLEKLSELEHKQWIQWSKTTLKGIEAAGDIATIFFIEKWTKNWKPYSELSEEVKEFDREWARKVLALIAGNKTKTTEQRIRDILEEHKICCSKKLMYKELRKLLPS